MMNDIVLYEKIYKENPDYNVQAAFPEAKRFALSALGYMYICRRFDEIEYINFEPIYLDTQRPRIMPKDVNLMSFSFSFDYDFLNILSILEKYKIPFKSKDRGENFPLIYGGGPVLTANPEPYYEIFDFMTLGDGEDVLKTVTDICRKKLPKKETLKLLYDVEGVYVPSLPKKEVKKLTCKNIKCITTPILSEESFFKNTFVIEIERGCCNMCGFCLASYLNLPIRFISYEEIIEKIDLGLKYTNKIALLGAMVARHPRFDDICKYIYDKIQNGQNIELSLSSLRVDNISEMAVKTLVASGQRHSTIAIEAASERLRRVINKNITEEQLFNGVKLCKENGLKGLKVYAMIGIPTETEEDLKEFISLASRLKKTGLEFSFAFSTFVPKPHTPFQWCKREDTKSLKKKQMFLKKEFHKIGIKAEFASPKYDYYQTILSLGSRDLSDALIDIYKNGGDSSAFKRALEKFNFEYSLDDELPWDFIKMNPPKEFLKSEYKRLLKY